MSLRKWLGLSDDDEDEVGGLEEIEQALTNLDPIQARFIACFAYILGRVARADHQVTADESGDTMRLTCSGFVWAGGQEKAPGSLTATTSTYWQSTSALVGPRSDSSR